MFTKIYSFILAIFLLISNLSLATIPVRSGWWKFDNPSNLTIAENGYGQDLTLVGSQSAASGPVVGNGSTLIGIGSYYKMNHLISPNGGGTKVNEYTIQYDFKIAGNGVWHSFFQSSPTNSDDADFFVNTSGNIGVGVVGYSGYSVIPNEWYRLLVSVKNGSSFTCYLDGKLLYTGTTQAVDGRFSLSDLLLIFADDNGEDASIYCSELSIWNQALDATQANELGGFGHFVGPYFMTRIPYLQGPGQTTMNVCWHDTSQIGTMVEYGLDPISLNLSAQGTSELVSEPYRWHTVKLIGLQPNTRYYYRVISGNEKSQKYSFKTLPDATYTGKIRFVILSDTHCPDSTDVGKVLRAAKAKITELYGPDIENHVNGILHSGDITVSGNVPEQYTTQYFRPLSVLSANLPTMVVAGNHEGESPFFYQYLKLDNQSAYPNEPGLNEKIWNLKVGNSLFIGLNSNIISQYGVTEANWLDARLNAAENDPSIDFVFLFIHHLPFSELWNISDANTGFVKNTLIPILKKYTKVQQLHYGHTHAFERGTIQSGKADGDFRIICGGGGGGALDPWNSSDNHDYNDIQISYSHHFFQILEIDIANHSYQNSMYSLGSTNDPRNSERLDFWYKNKNQSRPNTPSVENAEISSSYIQFNTSKFSGVDSIMTVQFQVIDSSDNSKILVDSLVHWKNIYGVDSYYKPVDKNLNINLYQSKVSLSSIIKGKTYLFKVRYRDQNLKWSNWSDSILFNTDGITGIFSLKEFSNDNFLYQNFPNPFSNSTNINFYIPEKSKVIFRIYDKNSKFVDEINEGVKLKGEYNFEYNAANLASGIYFYEMITNKFSISKKMVIIR